MTPEPAVEALAAALHAIDGDTAGHAFDACDLGDAYRRDAADTLVALHAASMTVAPARVVADGEALGRLDGYPLRRGPDGEWHLIDEHGHHVAHAGSIVDLAAALAALEAR